MLPLFSLMLGADGEDVVGRPYSVWCDSISVLSQNLRQINRWPSFRVQQRLRISTDKDVMSLLRTGPKLAPALKHLNRTLWLFISFQAGK